MKKIISFDLDGTLVDSEYGTMVWLEGVPEEYAGKYGLPLDEAKRAIKEQYDAISDTHLLWYDIDYWLDRFDLPLSVPDLLDRFSPYIRPLPYVNEVIRELSSKYTLVIASNAARVFVEKELSQAGLAPYFDHVFSATSDFRIVKKEAAFYHRLCETLAATPADLAHIGDHRVFDFEVPLSVGIDSFYFSPGAEAGAGVIRDFRELLERL
jgi:5'-nucleotidase